jgi:Transposase
MKKRFDEKQIIGIQKEIEAGMSVKEVCQEARVR